MDCDKWGGPVFIGTTALIAFLDGMLIPMAVAGVGSFFAYKYLCKLMDRSANAIYAKKEKEHKEQLMSITDPKQREKYAKKIKKDLEELSGFSVMDNKARNEAAKLVGIGTYICPPAAIAALAAAAVVSHMKNKK